MNENEYEITIEETLSKTVKVRAESLESAERKVKKSYMNGDIVLTAEDYDHSWISSIYDSGDEFVKESK